MGSGRAVVVIGGGIVGLSVAYYAMRKGHRVTVVERGAPGHDGCSLGNAGMIVPSHIVPLAAPGMVALGLRMMRNPEGPFHLRPRLSRDLLSWTWTFCRSCNPDHVARSAPILRDLSLATRRCYEELAEQFGNDFGLTQKGLLMLCKTERALHEEEEVAKLARKLGLEAAVLTPEETACRESGVRLDIAGAVYYPQDCHLTPTRLLPRLTRALEEGGAAFAWNTEARGWRAVGRRIEALETTQGDFTADEYVIAGGSWSPMLARPLGLRLPVQAGKGYSITLPNPPQRPSIGAILLEARVAMTPMETGLRFAGTMDIAGLDLSVNRARVNGMIKSIRHYLPDFAPEEFHDAPVWSGLRPCSPDGLPYIGHFARYDNLSAATGHAMMGLSLGPITGQLMAAVLSGERPAIDLAALRPDRYG